MNTLERDYSLELERRKAAGEILEWAYEPEALRLAKRTSYTPDFRVILPDGTVEWHECKGYWMDDARVKIKVAAEMHPYRFVGISRLPKKLGGGWAAEEF